jgi:hypothetical protein
MSNITEIKCPLGVLVIEPKTPKVRKKNQIWKYVFGWRSPKLALQI